MLNAVSFIISVASFVFSILIYKPDKLLKVIIPLIVSVIIGIVFFFVMNWLDNNTMEYSPIETVEATSTPIPSLSANLTQENRIENILNQTVEITKRIIMPIIFIFDAILILGTFIEQEINKRKNKK